MKTKAMKDVELKDVHTRIHDDPANVELLIRAAASVANAIHVGTGCMIEGTMMEQELRDALGLNPGELVNIQKV